GGRRSLFICIIVSWSGCFRSVRDKGSDRCAVPIHIVGKAIAVPIISGEPFPYSSRAASHLARMSAGYGRRTCEIMVPAGYQLPNNWRLAVHLDPFLVNAGSESTAEADEDVAGNPSRERDG